MYCNVYIDGGFKTATINSSNTLWCSKYFHWHSQLHICNKVINKIPQKSPQTAFLCMYGIVYILHVCMYGIHVVMFAALTEKLQSQACWWSVCSAKERGLQLVIEGCWDWWLVVQQCQQWLPCRWSNHIKAAGIIMLCNVQWTWQKNMIQNVLQSPKFLRLVHSGGINISSVWSVVESIFHNNLLSILLQTYCWIS